MQIMGKLNINFVNTPQVTINIRAIINMNPYNIILL